MLKKRSHNKNHFEIKRTFGRRVPGKHLSLADLRRDARDLSAALREPAAAQATQAAAWPVIIGEKEATRCHG